MNSIEPKSSHLRDAWVDRFGVRLMQLQPRMNAITAAEHAETTFPDAADLGPEEAAEIFAAEEPPGEVGASK